ncbi:MAG: alpha-glucosidase [Boseongicola sp.]|nr:MAG: alpha-glucosidase [Boseongicola sp.]
MSEWWKSAVIYQVYPRSFQDDNGDGIGDLSGVTRRLPYIASLGVDVIWLSPFFKSPMNDMGYDISDATDVDPLFGDLADFDEMLAASHALGLKVIIDQVPSHTAEVHDWFAQSRSAKEGPKSDWYVWVDAKKDGTPPNNWLSVFGGPAWSWEPRRKQYYLHSFLSSQPQLNFHNEEVVQATLDGMQFWLDRGVDGFRLDSINYPYFDPQFRDNPPEPEATEDDWVNLYNVQRHQFDKTQPENLKFLERVRSLVDGYPGCMLVGEVGEGRRGAEIMRDYTAENRLHMAYSFEMLGPDYTPEHFAKCVGGFFDGSSVGWPCWAFSNHDVERHAGRWGNENFANDVAKQAIALMVSLEGTKCLYQGEELGQVETDLEYSEIIDPPGLKFWPEYKGRDGCRTPMVWDSTASNAGFSSQDPWLPIKPAQELRSVNIQEDDPNSVLVHYRTVLGFYAQSNCLRSGETEFLEISEQLLVFNRSDAETLLCVFNLCDAAMHYSIPAMGELIGPSNAHIDAKRIELPPFGWAWIAIDQE